MKVRKWGIPITFVGLGGLGAMLFSERGRKLIQSSAERFSAAIERLSAAPGLAAWNDAAQIELDHIQRKLIELEQSLEGHIAH